MEYLRHKLPPDCDVVALGDVHLGARTCHEEALRETVEAIAECDRTWWLGMGDYVEGQPKKHANHNSRALRRDMQTAEAQYAAFADVIEPIADKCLGLGEGNHEWYFAEDMDPLTHLLCRPLEVPRGGYQTLYDLGHVRLFCWHGKAALPRGAKDPIQRDANRRAWLVNRMEALFGNAHVMLMGHVHHLIVQPPLQRLALMARGTSVRARHFIEPGQTVKTRDPVTGKADSREYIPPLARWYAVTGTFRRSGGPGYTDYAERMGYEPALIGYIRIRVRDGKVRGVEPVVV